MNSLVSVLNRAVVEQDRVVALKNCFATWDGQIDREVILQGIMERLTRMGKGDLVKGGLRLTRSNLDRVTVECPERTLFAITRFNAEPLIAPSDSAVFQHDGAVICVMQNAVIVDCFHKEEMQLLGRWAMDNAYHE